MSKTKTEYIEGALKVEERPYLKNSTILLGVMLTGTYSTLFAVGSFVK